MPHFAFLDEVAQGADGFLDRGGGVDPMLVVEVDIIRVETPQAVIDKLHAALVKTLDLAEVKDGLAKQGAEVFTGSPEDFRKFLAQDQGNTVKVIKAANLQAE